MFEPDNAIMSLHHDSIREFRRIRGEMDQIKAILMQILEVHSNPMYRTDTFGGMSIAAIDTMDQQRRMTSIQQSLRAQRAEESIFRPEDIMHLLHEIPSPRREEGWDN